MESNKQEQSLPKNVGGSHNKYEHWEGVLRDVLHYATQLDCTAHCVVRGSVQEAFKDPYYVHCSFAPHTYLMSSNSLSVIMSSSTVTQGALIISISIMLSFTIRHEWRELKGKENRTGELHCIQHNDRIGQGKLSEMSRDRVPLCDSVHLDIWLYAV